MSKRFNGQRRTGDPGDSRHFLWREGWRLVDEENGREYWTGFYQSGDTKVPGGLVRTASGKRRFYIKNPTPRFVRQAHNGGCQLKDAEAVEGAYRVHWERNPSAWADGINRIQEMI